MDKNFEEYAPSRGEDTGKQQNVRLRSEDEEILGIIAEVEGDKRILPLILEGVGRVIESRISDPEWMQKASDALEARRLYSLQRAEEIEAKIAARATTS